ncbi:MAG: glycosyltransferase family 39 protein [Chloroflexi bacterium]|nr:glycosyltransferase family 39 protein [Chloroflexota bacterium]
MKSGILPYCSVISILLLAVVLRFYDLGGVPAGLFADEASVGYNAYTILTAGVDEHGIPYPLFFKAFGEYKGPVQTYSTVPFVALFGLNEFSVRAVSALYGVLGVLAVFLLARELLQNHPQRLTISLLSALLLAISPWHLHFSRTALEGLMPFVLFTTLGLYFFLKAFASARFLILSALSFTLALYSYFPARIFIPLFVLGLVFVSWKFLLSHAKVTVLSILLSLLLLLPLFQAMLSPTGWARWEQVSILSQPLSDEAKFQHVVNNYLSHFSLDFLFLRGDAEMSGQKVTRHSVQGLGELYPFQLSAILLGLIFLFRVRPRSLALPIIFWLVLYPVGSTFTTDQSAQATRSIVGVVPFQILAALGFVSLFIVLRKLEFRALLTAMMIVVVAFSFQTYLQKYFSDYAGYSSSFWGWQYGPKEIMGYFLANKDSYDDLYLSGEFNGSGIFLRFYDPQGSCQGKCRIGDVSRTPRIYDPKRKQLFSLSPERLNKSSFNFSVHETVYYPDGRVAFFLGEVKGGM